MKSKDNMGYREYLLSDENIYLSIYSLNSYVFEYDLLDANDRELYHSLQDKFDKKVINKVILKVRKRIEELLNKDEEFIEVKVYFKPKKMSKDGLEFRPLHTTDLITQIAIVAMLHLFVYEIPEKKDYKLDVNFPEMYLEQIPAEKRAALIQILEQDPRPSYQKDPVRIYGMSYAGMEIHFRVDKETLYVTEVERL